MIKLKCFLASVVFIFSLTPYLYGAGNSGCGLGSVLMSGNKGSSAHSSATTSNGLFNNQMFGITSGTSNCKPDSAVGNEAKTKLYMAVNYHNLTEEMSRGEGEYLATYANMLGCSEESYNEFGKVTKEKFSQIVISAENSTQLLQNTIDMIQNNKLLKQSCTI